MSFWYYIVHVKKGFESVEHKFPKPSHTYLMCDRDFGILELKTLKTVAVYDPEFWFNFVELEKSKNPFKVRMMQEKHFVSVSHLNSTRNFRTKEMHGQLVHLCKAARIILSRKHPREILAIHIIFVY